MNYSVTCALFVIFLILISGCSSTTGSSSPTAAPPVTVLPSTPTDTFTVTMTPAGTPVQPVDPAVGSWLTLSFTSSGPLEKFYTFYENTTWTRTNRNLKTRVKSLSHGTWKAGSNNQYTIRSVASGGTATFTYDAVKDEFFEPTFQETFHRVADAGSYAEPAPVINLTLNSEWKADHLQNIHPRSGYRFLIVNVSLRNIQESEGFSLDERSLWIQYNDPPGTYAMHQMEEYLENLLPFGTIAPGETRQGNVIFAVPTGSHTYTLKLVDSRGDDAAERIIFENITA